MALYLFSCPVLMSYDNPASRCSNEITNIRLDYPITSLSLAFAEETEVLLYFACSSMPPEPHKVTARLKGSVDLSVEDCCLLSLLTKFLAHDESTTGLSRNSQLCNL